MSKRTADPERPAVPPDDDDDDDAPDFGRRAFGGPTASSWREQALTRIAELEDLTDLFRDPADPRKELLAQRIHRHLATARRAAGGSTGSGWARLKATVGGSPVERTASNVDAAEADLLRLAPATYLHGQLPSILAATRSHLKLDDTRRQQLEAICARQGGQPLTATERDFVIAATRAAASAARREIVQVRSFRNILYSATTVLTVAVVALVIIGAANSTLIPLCFTPENAVVCATNVTSPVEDDVTPERAQRRDPRDDGWMGHTARRAARPHRRGACPRRSRCATSAARRRRTRSRSRWPCSSCPPARSPRCSACC